MKKKLLIAVLVVVVLISAVSVWYYTSYPIISMGRFVSSYSDNFSEEFHNETISIFSVGSSFIPDSPLQKRKLDEVWLWNNSITVEVSEYVKAGGKALNIKASGEIEDGKTTLRYEGYIITKDGEKVEYLQEKTFDFELCSEKRFFTDKL